MVKDLQVHTPEPCRVALTIGWRVAPPGALPEPKPLCRDVYTVYSNTVLEPIQALTVEDKANDIPLQALPEPDFGESQVDDTRK